MTDWLQQRIDAFQFLISNPVFLVFALAIASIMYWFKLRLFKRALQKHSSARFAGWDAKARVVKRSHPTGIGHRDILAMKPPRRNLTIAFWTLLFFGGGAIFFWFSVLPKPDENMLKNWFVFAIMCVFSVLALMMFLMSFTQIEVSSDDFVLRRLFRRPKRFCLNSITKVVLAGKNPATGIKLTFSNGTALRLLASNDGYADVVSKIQHVHPDLRKFLMLGRMVSSSAKR